MNKCVHLILLFSSLSLMGAVAQTPIDPPSPPYTNKVRDFSSWEVIFHLKDSPDAGLPLNQLQLPVRQEIHVAKTDKTRQELTQWTNGKTSEIWYVGQYALEQTVYHPDIYIHAKDHDAPFSPSKVQSFDESDFPELGWLSADCYDKLTSYDGRKCYHFQVKQKAAIEVPTAPGAPKLYAPSPFAGKMQEAWIDAQTKLPIAWTTGDQYLRKYDFKIGGVDHLEVPERFSKALQAYLDRAKNAK